MKILRTIGILALVAGLVLGGAGSAFAQKPPPKRGLFGTVVSPVTKIDAVTYVIELETEEGTFDITADDTAKYMVPRETRGPKDLATFLGTASIGGDITRIVDRKLAVLATLTNEFTADAIRLMLIPSPDAPPLHAHRVGVVEVGAFDPSTSITIIDRDGVSHTFTVNEYTVYRPSVEDGGISELTGSALIEAIEEGYVTVVTKGDPKLPDPVAKAIVLHEVD